MGYFIIPKKTTAVMGVPTGKINDLANRVAALEAANTTVTTTNNTYEFAKGLCNGSNMYFPVANSPKYVDINGLSYFAGDGYTLSGPVAYIYPFETADGSNKIFTFGLQPIFVTMNTIDYFSTDGYTLATNTDGTYKVTFDVPPANGATIWGYVTSAYVITFDSSIAPLPNSIITSFFDTNLHVETPSGTIDGSNQAFTVSNTPKWIVINGRKYYSGDGYTYSAPTITVDALITPPTGSTLRSIY